MTLVSVVSAVSDLSLRSQTLTRARFAIHGSLTSLTWLQCGITDFTDNTDRWNQMILVLSGESVPLLPPLPGVRHRAPPTDDSDPVAEQWDREHAPATSADDGEGDAPD